MTKEEKLLKRLNVNSNYGALAKPTSLDEIKDYLTSSNKRSIDYLSEAAKNFLNKADDYALERIKIKMESNKNKTCLIIRHKFNKSHCTISSIKFRNANTGDIVTIDRDRTEYNVVENPYDINGYRYTMHMLWIDCYIWDGNTKNYNVNFDELEFLEFEINEETDTDYKLKLIKYLSNQGGKLCLI